LSRRVVPHPCLSRLRRWLEGTAASPHPSPSRRRQGKIPSIVAILRSDDDDDALHCPTPPLVAPSNICSRSHLLIVTSLLKPDAAALLPRQHHDRRPTPSTTLTPRQYRWRRCPRRDGSVDHVALVSSLSAGRPRRTGVLCASIILVRARLGSEYYYYFLLFVW
jgi:hypothetical protein